ncbi:MAG: hypothetical protein JWO02_1212 [Solirubrobacterales bacterium]|nr:hypothetical protein [Solirubrobacterales bacterium]
MDRAAILSLLERVRWHNVARVGALIALAALVVAWPHLSARPPSLPPARPVPVLAGPGTPPGMTASPVPAVVVPAVTAPRPATTARRKTARRKTARRKPARGSATGRRTRRPTQRTISTATSARTPDSAGTPAWSPTRPAGPAVARTPTATPVPQRTSPPRGAEFVPGHRDFGGP